MLRRLRSVRAVLPLTPDAHDHGTHALVKADKLPTEDNVDQLARIKRTDRLWLQELIIKHSQIIADLAAVIIFSMKSCIVVAYSWYTFMCWDLL